MAGYNVQWRIAMLGSTGAGKTSLIAALYNQFESVLDARTEQLGFVATAETGPRLNEHLANLQRAAIGAKGSTVDTETFQGTPARVEYSFRLEHFPSHTGLDIVFDDYPGVMLRYSPAEVDDIVEKARVILVAVDAPALMELPDYHYTKFHMPFEVADTLARAIQRAKAGTIPEDQQFMVLFVGMKCERWVRNGDGDALLQKFLTTYDKAVRLLNKNEVDLAFLPVQTLGSVEFDHYERRNDENEPPRAVYIKRSSATYEPRDCDQPLRYALGHMFGSMTENAAKRKEVANAVIKNRSMVKRIGWFVRRRFGTDRDFEELRRWEATSKALLDQATYFAEDCKVKGDGFLYRAHTPAQQPVS